MKYFNQKMKLKNENYCYHTEDYHDRGKYLNDSLTMKVIYQRYQFDIYIAILNISCPKPQTCTKNICIGN